MRDLRRLVAAVVMLTVPFAVGVPARALPVPGPLEAFQEQLTTFSTHAPGRVAIAVEDVASGVTTAKPETPFDQLQPNGITIPELGTGAEAIRLLQEAQLL